MDDVLERLAAAATRADLTVGAVESLTSGALASRIGAGPDAARWFRGAVVAYQTGLKVEMLGMEDGRDPCSPDAARELARGGRGRLGADVVVAVTGVGGPDVSDGHPPGTVHIGWCSVAGAASRMHVFEGDPAQVITQSVDAALSTLLEVVEAHLDAITSPHPIGRRPRTT